MPVIDVPTGRITDWKTFHDVFAEILGFPDFYGRDMSAWNDCLMHADEDVGMLDLVVPPGDVLPRAIAEAGEFAHRCPELYAAIVDGAAFVDDARIEAGDRPIVAVSPQRRVAPGLTAGRRRFHVKTRLPTSLPAFRRPGAPA